MLWDAITPRPPVFAERAPVVNVEDYHRSLRREGRAIAAIPVPETRTHPELIAHVKSALGSVPAPKQILFTEALPLNPAGKVDKKALRKPYWQNQTRQVG